jgi:hypothetical protein
VGIMHRFLKRLWIFTKLAIFLTVVGLLVTREYQPPGAFSPAVNRLVADDAFDFVGWEAGALDAKGAGMILPAPDYVSESRRKSLVLDYMKLVQRIDTLQNEIDDIYADPTVTNPTAASASRRAELAQLREQQAAQQSTVETIVEQDISAILNEQGFALGGQVIPPLRFRFTPLPQMLIISPRDEIYQKDAFPLVAGLTTDRAEELEAQVERRFGDVSALVVPIGGLGIYPTMLLESTSLEWMIHTAAHEWTHNWLELRPLGMNYDKSPETRTMNETTADIVGTEVGDMTLRQFFPELAPPPQPAATPGPKPTPAPTPTRNPNVFDFRAEMHITRVEVDRLLAEARAAEKSGDQTTADARIQAAEDYMRERRKVFVDHGYLIRKLNQAYFAFYGAYADQPGAAGADPVGPAVKQLRDRSPSLLAFLEAISPMTSFAELERALGE